MLTAASGKGLDGKIFEADALQLPVSDGSLDAVTAAFGFRNFVNYERGLNELLRVLKPGGTAAILEFSQPPNAVFAKVYNFYSRAILPKIGGAFRVRVTLIPIFRSRFVNSPMRRGWRRRCARRVFVAWSLNG